MRTLTLALCFIVAIGGIGLDAQQGTDFSGKWVLDEGPQRSAAVPHTLIVQQPLTTTNRLGGPMAPAYLSMTVERYFADRVQRDTYEIGMSGGVVGGPTSRPCRFSVRWNGNALWIESQCFTASGGVLRGSTEVWRLDERARLVIRVEKQEGDAVEMRALAFRREAK